MSFFFRFCPPKCPPKLYVSFFPLQKCVPLSVPLNRLNTLEHTLKRAIDCRALIARLWKISTIKLMPLFSLKMAL